jgi:hypothetical protein
MDEHVGENFPEQRVPDESFWFPQQRIDGKQFRKDIGKRGEMR